MDDEFAAYVAIDWADQQHCWALEMPGSSSRQSGTLDHRPEAVDVWAAELRLRFSGMPVAVALEQSRGPLVFMLTKYEHLVVFPVHPTALANYRKSFRPSGAKNDPHDAGLLLDILVRHRDKLRRLNPDTAETRTLQFLVEERRKLVHEKTRYSNRLTAHLKMYFPRCWTGSTRLAAASRLISCCAGPAWRIYSAPDGRPSSISLSSTTAGVSNGFENGWSRSAKPSRQPRIELWWIRAARPLWLGQTFCRHFCGRSKAMTSVSTAWRGSILTLPL